MAEKTQLLHATSISLEGFGIMIGGPAGIGKSALALDLLNDAHGFEYILLNSGSNFLIADDQTYVGTEIVDGEQKLVGRCPPNIEGMFEVRGLGVIKVPFKSPAAIDLYVEIVDILPARMPDTKNMFRYILNVKIPYIQIYKEDRYAKARVRAALYAHSRNKFVS